MLKIATWNVNSLRVRLPQVLDWTHETDPDILALQETKLQDADFPRADCEAAGFQAVYAGQKTYNGVAILSRLPAQEVQTDLPGMDDDPQRRLLAATYGGVRVVNVYVPNGESVGSEKYAYKLRWLERLTAFLEGQLARYPRLVLLGDFNIAPEPRDVHDPELWEGRVLFSEAERQAFRELLAIGLCDTFRLFEQEEKSFSWWDYRMAAFRRNLGLRIDHILASPELCQRCRASTIDRAPRGWERPSDHAPVISQFDI
ncbi:MAG TPA: exodeoxyribonuclease III [Gammaproteobacteria bacterium]|nr:exodeoxyribonuclease III [Gammaproteobacteria bacterium]